MGSKSYSKGISWIDDCRIPFEGENTMRSQYENKVQVGMMAERPNIKFVGSFNDDAKQGRFPANILVSDDMLNDGVITKTISSKGHIRKGNVIGDNRTPVAAGLFGDGNWIEGTNINDKGSNSRYYNIDKWFDKILND